MRGRSYDFITIIYQLWPVRFVFRGIELVGIQTKYCTRLSAEIVLKIGR